VTARVRQLPGALLALTLLAGTACAEDPAADLEAQHQAAVAILNRPPVSGLLIAEVLPESVAAVAGMRGGDVLTEYHGTRVTTVQGLTELVADAVARRLQGAAVGQDILARVRRADRELILVLPRDVLGLRAVEVRAGVPGPRNPPPNARGTLALDWQALAKTLHSNAVEGPEAFRIFERRDPQPGAAPSPGAVSMATEEWSGWELCTVQPEGEDALVGSIERYHLVAAAAPATTRPEPVTECSTVTFRLRLGDYKTLPAFVLEEMTARYPVPTGPEGSKTVVGATRRGETLQVTIGTVKGDEARTPDHGGPHENAAPLSAIPQAALPWVAAALPHTRGDALGLYLLSIRGLLPLPGYVLATRGRQPLPSDPAALVSPETEPQSAPAIAVAPTTGAPAAAWRVDLMLCGVVLESYWFSDQRRLLCVQTLGPQAIIARRVDNARTAAMPLERKPAPPGP
jgi:hypothetical protein